MCSGFAPTEEGITVACHLRAALVIAAQEFVEALAHLATQFIARADVELALAICDVNQDYVLNSGRGVFVYVIDQPRALGCDLHSHPAAVHVDVRGRADQGCLVAAY